MYSKLHAVVGCVLFYSSAHFFPPRLSLRTSTRQITPAAPQPAASSSNTTTRGSSRGTSSTCRSTTSSLSFGVSTLSSPWVSARWRGPLLPTTGPSPNLMISPCSPSLQALCAHSGRLMNCYVGSIPATILRPQYLKYMKRKDAISVFLWSGCLRDMITSSLQFLPKS